MINIYISIERYTITIKCRKKFKKSYKKYKCNMIEIIYLKSKNLR